MKEPLVSIIMPVYNGEKYLENTINSICESKYKNIELLCINDCSTDNSMDICKKFEEKDDRVKVYTRTENGGVAQARNTGLQICEGRYVCFADQDDIVENDFYTTLISDILQNNCQIAIANVKYMVDGIPKQHKTIRKSCAIEGKDREDLLKWLVFDKSDSNIPLNTISKTVWNCMFDSALIKKNDITFKRIVAYEDDWLFLLENIRLSNRVFLEEKELYTWRIHKSQTTQNPKYIDNYLKKRKKLRDFVFLQIQGIPYDDNEMQDYNEEYIIRLISEGLINEVNTRKNWSEEQFRTAKMHLEELWEFLQQYLTKEMLKNIRSKIRKNNSFYNAIPQIFVTYELFSIAIKSQMFRNFIVCKAKKIFG